MDAQLSNARALANWPEALVDAEAFRREQSALSHVWTFLGLARDVAHDGDWFRATLAAREVFVQRFGDELRGFENRCAHRSFPLRTADKGNGPIVCGFHHWRYDKEGCAIGIPQSRELFGLPARELGARLEAVEIAACGEFIFGRFAQPGDSESLEQFLGDSFPILEAMSQSGSGVQHFTRSVAASWRLCYHTSVEDYHIVAVHPGTFGKGGYLKRDRIGYFRFGRHSAFFTDPDPDGLTAMAAGCRGGDWRSKNYRVFHIFPNLTVAHFRADRQFWYILVLQYAPAAADRSEMRAWFYPAPFAADLAWYERWTRAFTDPVRGAMVRHYVNKVLREDNVASERLQSNAARMADLPFLGGLEERLAWFEEAYAAAMQ